MTGSNNFKTLITGNGFDLAHYLPTSYKDFINFVLAIEAYKGDKTQVGFETIFAKFDKTWLENVRKYYSTEHMVFDLTVFDDKLENVWLNYFKPILTIETWIDFEIEIAEALKIVTEFCNYCDEILKSNSTITGISKYGSGSNGWHSYQSNKSICLFRLGIVEGRSTEEDNTSESCASKFLKNLCFKGGITNNIRELDRIRITSHLLSQLDNFIQLFSDYLKLVTTEFYNNIKENQLNGLSSFSETFTLNYTNTIATLYPDIANEITYHLHGSLKKSNNIVLGVAEIDERSLGVQALGFTKYYQTLFKETKFGFLDDKSCNAQKNRGVDYFVWGHSLDRSDEKYIKRLFDEISFELAHKELIPFKPFQNSFYGLENVPTSTITIYFHCPNSKASLLKNLLSIVGKETIEKSIRTKYLKFLPSPPIWKDQLEVKPEENS